METNPSREEQPIEYQLDALRDSANVARWKEMEVKYMCYARMVGSFQKFGMVNEFFDVSLDIQHGD